MLVNGSMLRLENEIKKARNLSGAIQRERNENKSESSRREKR